MARRFTEPITQNCVIEANACNTAIKTIATNLTGKG
jgi:hypothetical protein